MVQAVEAGHVPVMAARIVEEFNKLGQADEVKAAWASNGAEFGGLSSQDFGKMVSGEVKRWAQVVKASGAKLE